MQFATQNKDLIWDLDAFQQRQRAIDFVMSFENKLCVYSNSVEQLYTNYNLFFPKEEDRKLVILPNPYAHHDSYNGVPESAIVATRLNIVPGQMFGKSGTYITIPFKSGKTRYRAVPLQVGLRVLNQHRGPGKPLLPVLVKGDLRELNATTPCLHLHSINLDKLTDLSMLERQSIRQVILERLALIS
ncbi:hypothetical protein ACXYTJ_07320 [Gilvimarinus sp. F26214L]|uniref:hypothetical protein n=1 Tax=Gilvimarinus sp. DZF01 TaxID=3461371 RepID=UPI00404638D4